jgi:hypothetical protein
MIANSKEIDGGKTQVVQDQKSNTTKGAFAWFIA